ncbi:hypothetical protein [Terrarubrum flagellatum]|uniref:hypothetical protein n=1 Tax=Terrirubrum flagellatum TaxID=2895980 RepID=UPI0031451DCC
MRRFVRLFAFAAAAGLATMAVSSARTIIPAEQRDPSWSGAIPACGDPAVISDVQQQFAQREDNYWRLGLRISSVDRIRSIGYQPWGADYIPRRFCVARAIMSDGRVRTLSYNIIERGAIIGWSWGTEWCVSGLDREFYFAPDCKMARP